MIAIGEKELICDFAETYHILDYKSLPVRLAAILAVGMREDSRIRMKIRGDRIPTQEVILAMIFDLFQEYVWAVGGGEADSPRSMLKLLNDEEAVSNGKVRGFSTPEEFEEARRRLMGG